MELNLVELYRALCDDAGVGRKTQAYIVKRLQNEGAFVVMSLLPRFAKHLLACIEAGRWSSFGTEIRERQGLPIIFRGYLLDIFKLTPDGTYVLKDVPCPVALWAIRQVCEYTFKLSVPFTDDELARASEKFLELDEKVLTSRDYDHNFIDLMRKRLETFYPEFCRISLDRIAALAHPGPGTFSGSNSEYWMRNYQQPAVRSRYSHLAFGLRFNTAAPKALVSDCDPSYSEVLFVPKDSRGPRVIVREPYDSLLFQMGFNTASSRALERDSHNRINFKSQDINKNLAAKSSITRFYATLDLKDASDSVSLAIVSHLFRYLPCHKALHLFRTRAAKLPTGAQIDLKKLSGMGSGFTFPTMALVIHLAICTQVSQDLRIPYRQCMKHCYVYGDDIIVPSNWWNSALIGLSKAGLVVNSEKSYVKGPFRESCGGDYLHGNDVAPVRLKLASADPNIVGETLRFGKVDGGVLCLERHARELVTKQLFMTASYIYTIIESFTGPLPLVTGDSHVLGRYTEDRSAVLNELKTDSSGNHAKAIYWVVRPIRGLVRDPCPYQHLLRTLSMSGLSTWYKDLYPAGRSSSFGDVSRPRMIKLVRRKLNSFVRT